MDKKTQNIILITIGIIVGLYFLFAGLVKASSVLGPLVMGALLAMLVLPIARKLEGWGMKRGWGALLGVLTIILFIAGLLSILAFQIKSLAEDWPKIKEQLKPTVTQAQEFIEDKFGISPEEQKEKVKESMPGNSEDEKGTESSGASGSGTKSMIERITGGLAASLLTFAYVFFFLLYRLKFKKSILKFFSAEKRGEVSKVIDSASKVAQQYLNGKLILMIILAVLYSVGLSIIGIKHAILISLLAAVLTLIPYIGNLIGGGLAATMALFTGGNITDALGVIGVFALAQFIETYTLEPFVVGHKVNLNPVMTIIAVVVGEVVWSVPGMIMAIPVLGIFKIIFDHIPALQPLGYALGTEDTEEENEGKLDKAGKWIRNKIKGLKNKGS